MCTCRRSLLRGVFVLALWFVTRAEEATRLCGSKDACLETGDLSSGHVALVQGRVVKTPKKVTVKSQIDFTHTAADRKIGILEVTGRRVNESSVSVASTMDDTTTLPPTGISLNSAGDFTAFMSATVTEVAIIVGCVVAFSVLRQRYPIVYQGNVEQGFAPKIMDSQKQRPTLFGWIKPAWNVRIIDIAESVGLDQAMMIKYFEMAMSISAIAGFPMVFIVGTMNYFFGGHAKPGETMSAIGMNNVVQGSWLCWVHAFCVWGVVLLVKHKVFEAQKLFMHLRFEWLRTMDSVRANTIMVESIPYAYRNDKALWDYFEDMLPGDQVKEATCIKDTTVLHKLVVELDDATLQKRVAEKELETTKERPQVSLSWFGQKIDAINHYTQRVQYLEKEVQNERERITKNPQYMGCAFVTFKESKDAVIALQLQLSSDIDEWVLSIPPHAKDIVWSDFLQDETAENSRHLLGWGLVVGLFFVYMPLVIGITNLAKSIQGLGPLQSLWDGMAPTLGLTIMVMFLPTLILLIFKSCFTLYANQFAQLKLQRWYFWMQVLFVVFAAAIGQDFQSFVLTFVESPLSLLSLLADRLPAATHFFWNYLVLGWASHAMEMLRKVQLGKFKVFQGLNFSEEEAKKLAEPEDQDYSGIGGRSARATIMMTIGLVYGTISPFLMILTSFNFVLSRIFFGYLVTFAETRKPDLGGYFWVVCQQQTLSATLLYSLIMSGLLLQKAYGYGPAIISVASVVYVVWSMRRFEHQFAWQKLSFEEIMDKNRFDDQEFKDLKMKRRDADGEYVQPELKDAS
eukprot:TRINITY_DN2927_c0_g8_i1.p1 TRINITY_DN2927_c0_g8~~TRINITY_DN2927_c0_g8_i1.p1  ORF type:complete len:797 (-),score=136.95 TRINITY_DN2927_c0_g8_i1:223-2613(-)